MVRYTGILRRDMTVDVRVLLLLLLLKQTAIATRDFTDNNKTQKKLRSNT